MVCTVVAGLSISWNITGFLVHVWALDVRV
jgi:hypothetical protein